jgi:heat shock protein HslJ
LALLALAGCASMDPHVQEAKRLVRGDEPVISGTLEGGVWVVEDVNGGGVIDDARLDASFAEGKVSGRSGCNRYNGQWQQDGANIRIGPLMSTRMACAPALMTLEQKFLAALEAASLVSFDATGAAFLKAPDGRVLRMRRQAENAGPVPTPIEPNKL